MKKRLALCCMMTGCILLPLLFPSFWKENISLPWIRFANRMGNAVPFSVFEWSIAALAAWMTVSFIICMIRGKLFQGLRMLLKRMLCLLMTVTVIFTAVWLPLYENTEFLPATAAQLEACAEDLILILNENPPDFSHIPRDPTVKTAAFPFWMHRLNILGFYSFFTGEAILSPDLPPPLLPFVAVHESIHGQGVADEGLCNIRAYEECLIRSGKYAASARIWALKYLLGELRNSDYNAFAQCFEGMNEETRHLLQQSGGIYEKAKGSILSVFAPSGGASGYEILAHHLAGAMDG